MVELAVVEIHWNSLLFINNAYFVLLYQYIQHEWYSVHSTQITFFPTFLLENSNVPFEIKHTHHKPSQNPHKTLTKPSPVYSVAHGQDSGHGIFRVVNGLKVHAENRSTFCNWSDIGAYMNDIIAEASPPNPPHIEENRMKLSWKTGILLTRIKGVH